MRYLTVGAARLSRIGLGTWQFGSREVADAHSATPAQMALAWAIHRPAVVAIPGASSVAQLESNVAAADLQLADDEYRALSEASDRFRPVTGPAALPRLVRARFT